MEEKQFASLTLEIVSLEQYQEKKKVILRNNQSTIFSNEDKLKKY